MESKEKIIGDVGLEYFGQEFYNTPGAQGPSGPKGPQGRTGLEEHQDQLKFDFMNKDENDINHPHHYTAGGIEVFDFIQSWGLDFAEGNVVKYVVRGPFKGNRLKDLKKARWYLNKLIERAEQDKA